MGRLSLFLFVGFLASCSWQPEPRPSVLLIAVEQLGFDSLACGSDAMASREMAGFKLFCDEGARFTHAFTSSTMSQAAMATILTGLYPFEHLVRHNGPSYLSTKFPTVSRVAAGLGFRTGFFSGGPPIFRKSGLSQGFEWFDDFLSVDHKHLYRPAEETAEAFHLWLRREVSGEPFFAVLYFPDLQFPEVETVNDLGEPRERSYNGQLRELSDALLGLQADLRKLKVWDSTHVFLVGLNGYSQPGLETEPGPTRLSSLQTQVALFIKPARKPRDSGLEWKIDKNVSLADLGVTLFDVLGKPQATQAIRSVESPFVTVSLKSVMKNPDADWASDRWIPVESAWSEWRGLGPPRVALRKDQFLLIYDQKLKIYNTLIDRMEAVPTPSIDPIYQSLKQASRPIFARLGAVPWQTKDTNAFRKIQLAQTLWRSPQAFDEVKTKLARAMQDMSTDSQISAWGAELALEEEDWPELTILGQRSRQTSWQWVGQKNLKGSPSVGLEKCAKLLAFGRGGARDCDDAMFLQLIGWARESDASQKAQLQETFLRNYLQYRADQTIARMNWINSLSWDIPVDQPNGPNLSDLFLRVGENKKYLQQVKARLLRENQNFGLAAPFEF